MRKTITVKQTRGSIAKTREQLGDTSVKLANVRLRKPFVGLSAPSELLLIPIVPPVKIINILFFILESKGSSRAAPAPTPGLSTMTGPEGLRSCNLEELDAVVFESSEGEGDGLFFAASDSVEEVDEAVMARVVLGSCERWVEGGENCNMRAIMERPGAFICP